MPRSWRRALVYFGLRAPDASSGDARVPRFSPPVELALFSVVLVVEVAQLTQHHTALGWIWHVFVVGVFALVVVASAKRLLRDRTERSNSQR